MTTCMDAIMAIRQRIEEARERMESLDFVTTLRDGFQESLAELAGRIEFSAASLYVFLPWRQRLHKVSDYRGGVNFINKVRFERGYGLSAWVAKKQQPVYLPDIHRGTRHGHTATRSYISIPILEEEEVLGVLNLSHIKPNAFERSAMLVIRNFLETLKPLLRMYQRQYHANQASEANRFTRR